MKFLRSIRDASLWGAALILALMPLLVAADFGGVLWWTHYVAALAVATVVVFATASLFDSAAVGAKRQYAIVGVLLAWTLFAWAQIIPLSPQWVGFLSPASATAYTDWISPFVAADKLPQSFPITLSAEGSRHAAAMLTLLIGIAWASLTVFQTRARIAVFLAIAATSAAAHAAFGLFRTVYPETPVWGIEMANGSFGAFVNRNNAALLLNLGMAASLGLLAWRLTALTGQEVDDPGFEINDLMSLVSDRESAIGLLGVTLCSTGLLVSGSRGGIVSAIGGFLLALGWVRQRRGFTTIPVVGVALVCGILLLVVPFNLSLSSIKNFNVFSDGQGSTLLEDGRFSHWGDGLAAGKAHFPLGSGLASYSYAYLPFQQSSSKAWYHHADNLWLEMFTEQGIVGLALSILLFWILIRALRRLGESVDPIDQGLRVAGWYALGAIAVSQWFDFGLIIPANLILTVVLFSIILAREAQTTVATATSGRGSLFRSKQSRLTGVLAAAFGLSATTVAILHLKTDAWQESVLRTAKAHFDGDQANADVLAEWQTRLLQVAEARPSAQCEDLICEFEYQILRLEEFRAAGPLTEDEANAAYRSTRPLDRRRTELNQAAVKNAVGAENDSTQDSISSEADDTYQAILGHSERSLVALPLGPSARKWQLYLDFTYDDPERADAALLQLTQIYQRNAAMLVRLAAFAGDGGKKKRAVELSHAALRLAPTMANQAMERTERWDDVSPEDVLLDEPQVWRFAARYVLQRERENEALLRRCHDGLQCQLCESKSEKSDCEAVAGDLAYQLRDFDVAFEHYRVATELNPGDANLRYRYVMRLKETGRRDKARAEAQAARSFLKTDDRFDRFIKKMADEDRVPVES